MSPSQTGSVTTRRYLFAAFAATLVGGKRLTAFGDKSRTGTTQKPILFCLFVWSVSVSVSVSVLSVCMLVC